MAIDKQKTKEMLDSINELFDTLPIELSDKQKDWFKKNIFGKVVSELESLVTNSRPPIIYVFGRSGHGKSSLINAMAGKPVADVNPDEPLIPNQEKAKEHFIAFPEQFSEWKIIDSRGLFDFIKPKGITVDDAVEQLFNEVLEYKPDILIHTFSVLELRSPSEDFKIVKRLQQKYEKEKGSKLPIIFVVTKIDTLGRPSEWPIEKYPKKRAELNNVLTTVTDKILNSKYKKLNLNDSIKGFSLEENEFDYIYLIPVNTLEKDEWNIDTLLNSIGSKLPQDAVLDFYQGTQRKELIQRLSTTMIKKFTAISIIVGSSPIPFSDIAVLIPLQAALVALIGGLSCRKMNLDTVAEYGAAIGINILGGQIFKKLYKQILKFIPFGGPLIAGAISGVGTYTLGKSAELYFFHGKVKKPTKFISDYIKNHR